MKASEEIKKCFRKRNQAALAETKPISEGLLPETGNMLSEQAMVLESLIRAAGACC